MEELKAEITALKKRDDQHDELLKINGDHLSHLRSDMNELSTNFKVHSVQIVDRLDGMIKRMDTANHRTAKNEEHIAKNKENINILKFADTDIVGKLNTLLAYNKDEKEDKQHWTRYFLERMIFPAVFSAIVFVLTLVLVKIGLLNV